MPKDLAHFEAVGQLHPLKREMINIQMPEGCTITEVVQKFDLETERYGIPMVTMVRGGEMSVVPLNMWGKTRPKLGTDVQVTFPVRDPGSIALIASLAIPQAATAIAALTPFAVGSLGYALVAAAVTIVGTLLVQALIPPAKTEGASGVQNYAITGTANAANPYGVFPTVLGRHRIYPPLTATGFSENAGQDVYYYGRMTFGYGPIALEDLRIGTTPITEFAAAEVELEFRNVDRDLTLAAMPGLAPFVVDRTGEENKPRFKLTEVGKTWTFAPRAAADQVTIEFNVSAQDKVSGYTFVVEEAVAGSGTWAQVASFTLQDPVTNHDPLSGLQETRTFASASYSDGVEREYRVTLTGSTPREGDYTDNWLTFFSGKGVDAVTITKATATYHEVQPGWRYGTDSMFLYPEDITQDDENALPEPGAPVVRYTREASSAASVDISFSRGLYDGTDDGLESHDASFAIYYQPVAGGIVEEDWVLVASPTYEAKSTTALRYTVPMSFPEPGQYAIKIERTSGIDYSTRDQNRAWVTAIRSMSGEPLPSPEGIAEVAFKIKASDQLNGRLDSLNGIVQQLAPVWDGSVWTDPQPVRHPAWLYAQALRGPQQRRPVADSRLDLDAIKAWADKEPHWTCDYVIDTPTQTAEVLDVICAAGRARRTLSDFRWSVIRDGAAGPVRQTFTPRNSWGYKAQLAFPREIHGFRVKARSERLEWEEDEILVLKDGFTRETATELETLQLAGTVVTADDEDEGNAYRLGRYHLAVAENRPETHTFFADWEHIRVQRGDKIRFVHDVPLIGVGAARIKGITEDGSGNVTTITLDELFDFERDSFRLAVRNVQAEVIFQALSPEDPRSRVWTPEVQVLAADIAVGDLVAIEETEQVSAEMLVTGIYPRKDESAKITCVDAVPAILQADTGTIPTYSPIVTNPRERADYGLPPAPAVISAYSDSTTQLILPDLSVRPRIAVQLAPFATRSASEGLTKQLRWREAGSASVYTYGEALAGAEYSLLTGALDEGLTYEGQVRIVAPDGQTRGWKDWPNTVVASIAAPAPPAIAAAVTASSVPDAAGNGRRPAIELAWTPSTNRTLRVTWEVRVAATGAVVQRGLFAEASSSSVLIADGILPATDYEVHASFVTAIADQRTWSAWLPVTTGDIRLIAADLSDGAVSYVKVAQDVKDAISDASQSAASDKAAAEAAALAAQAAETGAVTAQGNAQTAQSLAEGAHTDAAAARDAAQLARDAAQEAETNAETAQTNAETAATNAGSAVTAAETARDAAVGAAGAADGSATAASGFATTASNHADAAEGSASAASGSATTAQTAAGNASTSAGNAATSETNAEGSASAAASSAVVAAEAGELSLLRAGGNMFSNPNADDQSHFGASVGASLDVVTHGQPGTSSVTALEVTQDTDGGSGFYLKWMEGLGPVAGRTIRFTVKARKVGSAGTVINLRAHLRHAKDPTSVHDFTQVGAPASYDLTETFEEYEFESTINETSVSNAIAWRPMIDGGTGGELIELTDFVVRDVTAEAQAEGHASAAATSASNAAASETEAGQQASAAQTARTGAETARSGAETAETNASTSATNAAGSASSASTSASNAATSANEAGDSADAASSSASTASTKANEAGQSATAAQTARTGAETARGGAETAESNAAQSETNAAGSASSAATSATNAANSANDAGDSATAASNSASAASTSATNAGQSASAANTSANNASTSAGNAASSAGEASTSAGAAAASASDAAGSASSAATSEGLAAAAEFNAGTRAQGNLTDDPAAADASLWGSSSGGQTTVETHGQSLPSSDTAIRVTLTQEFGGCYALRYEGATPLQGRRLRITAKVRGSANGNSISWTCQTGDGDGSYTPGPEYFTPYSTAFQEISFDVDLTGIDSTHTALRFRIMQYGESSGYWFEITDVVLEDVTESHAAYLSANAAAGSASSAASSADAAGESASAANTSETNAATSAGTASTKAGEASASASSAEGYSNQAAAYSTVAATLSSGNMVRDANLDAGIQEFWGGSSSSYPSYVTHGQPGTRNPRALRSQDPSDGSAGFYSQPYHTGNWNDRVLRFRFKARGSEAMQIACGPGYRMNNDTEWNGSDYDVVGTLPGDQSFAEYEREVRVNTDAATDHLALRWYHNGGAAGAWSEITDLEVFDVTAEVDAGLSANAAASSASTADTYRDDAESFASAANTSATNAATAESNANTFANQASQAKQDAESAESSAIDASGVAIEASRLANLRAGGNLFGNPDADDLSFFGASIGASLAIITHTSTDTVSDNAMRLTQDSDGLAGCYLQWSEPLGPVAGRTFRLTLKASGHSMLDVAAALRVAKDPTSVSDFAQYGLSGYQNIQNSFTEYVFEQRVSDGAIANTIAWRLYVQGGDQTNWAQFTDIKVEEVTGAAEAQGHASAASNSADAAFGYADDAEAFAGAASQDAQDAAADAADALAYRNTAVGARDDAETAAASAQSWAGVAATVSKEGGNLNPIFNDGLFEYYSYDDEGSITLSDTDPKYSQYVVMESAATPTSDRPLLQYRNYYSNYRLGGAHMHEWVKVVVEIEKTAGNIECGTQITGQWSGVSSVFSSVCIEDQLINRVGAIQRVEVILQRPAGYTKNTNDDNLYVGLYATTDHPDGSGRKYVQFRVHSFTVTSLNAQATATLTQRAVAKQDGWASSLTALRSKAGSAGAELELVALSDEGGSASSARLAADNILLEGSVYAKHLTVGDTSNMIPDAGMLDGSQWTLSDFSIGNASEYDRAQSGKRLHLNEEDLTGSPNAHYKSAYTPYAPIEPGRSYRFACDFRAGWFASSGRAMAVLHFYDAAGNTLSGGGWIGEFSVGVHIDEQRVSEIFQAPANAVMARIQARTAYDGNGEIRGPRNFYNFSIRPAVDPSLVVNGLIKADSALIDDAAIGTLKIAGNAVTIPKFFEHGRVIDNPSTTNWVHVISTSLDREGYATRLSFGGQLSGIPPAVRHGKGAVANFEVRRDGATFAGNMAHATGYMGARNSFSFTTTDLNTDSGYTVYSVYMKRNANGQNDKVPRVILPWIDLVQYKR